MPKLSQAQEELAAVGFCACGCGEILDKTRYKNTVFASVACKQRAYRQRLRSAEPEPRRIRWRKELKGLLAAADRMERRAAALVRAAKDRREEAARVLALLEGQLELFQQGEPLPKVAAGEELQSLRRRERQRDPSGHCGTCGRHSTRRQREDSGERCPYCGLPWVPPSQL